MSRRIASSARRHLVSSVLRVSRAPPLFVVSLLIVFGNPIIVDVVDANTPSFSTMSRRVHPARSTTSTKPVPRARFNKRAALEQIRVQARLRRSRPMRGRTTRAKPTTHQISSSTRKAPTPSFPVRRRSTALTSPSYRARPARSHDSSLRRSPRSISQGGPLLPMNRVASRDPDCRWIMKHAQCKTSRIVASSAGPNTTKYYHTKHCKIPRFECAQWNSHNLANDTEVTWRPVGNISDLRVLVYHIGISPETARRLTTTSPPLRAGHCSSAAGGRRLTSHSRRN